MPSGKIGSFQSHGNVAINNNEAIIGVETSDDIYEKLATWELSLSVNEVVLIDAKIVSGEAAFVLFSKSFNDTFSNQEIVTQSHQLLLVLVVWCDPQMYKSHQ
jgi:hypothetical protein